MHELDWLDHLKLILGGRRSTQALHGFRRRQLDNPCDTFYKKPHFAEPGVSVPVLLNNSEGLVDFVDCIIAHHHSLSGARHRVRSNKFGVFKFPKQTVKPGRYSIQAETKGVQSGFEEFELTPKNDNTSIEVVLRLYEVPSSVQRSRAHGVIESGPQEIYRVFRWQRQENRDGVSTTARHTDIR
jgi:hypothetical protein